jgi:chromosome partitioning protein
LLVDSDPQGSLRDWNEASEGKVLPVVGLDRETLPKDLEAVKKGYDIIIIDGAPQSARLAGAAVRAADMILIPVTPSPYDVWAASDLVEIIRARHEVTNGKPPAYFVISRARKNTRLSADVTEALQDYELPMLEARTTHREIYARSAADGETVYHHEPNGEAVEEMDMIKDEVLRIVKDGVQSKNR